MKIKRRPWERRLEDLSYILDSCFNNYFKPDLFRRNTNHFLQTARTVTFIIQKNKAVIPNFSNWYQENVIDKWLNDDIMQWAKNSRNTIEKEGDLDLFSTLNISLIFSYLEEEDVKIDSSNEELLNANISNLIKFSKNKLPRGIAQAAGIKIERSWKTAKLSNYELLHALQYVYSRLYDCSLSLVYHLKDSTLPKSIPPPSEFSNYNNISRHIELIKLKDLQSYRLSTKRINKIPLDKLPREFSEKLNELKNTLDEPKDFKATVQFFSKIAESNFKQWGNYINILFFLNHDWSVQYITTPLLVDQTDKYFFWRMIGEQVNIQKPHCLIHTTEVWIRDISNYSNKTAFGELPIKGECLQLSAIDNDGNKTVITWDINRKDQTTTPILNEPVIQKEGFENQLFFLVPAMCSMDLPIDFI